MSTAETQKKCTESSLNQQTSALKEDLKVEHFDYLQQPTSFIESKEDSINTKLSERNVGTQETSNTDKVKELKCGTKKESSTTILPKIKLKLSKESPILEISETNKTVPLKSTPVSKGNRTQSGVEIVRNKFRSYMMFPVISSPEDSDENSNSSHCATSEPKWEIATANASTIQSNAMTSGMDDTPLRKSKRVVKDKSKSVEETASNKNMNSTERSKNKPSLDNLSIEMSSKRPANSQETHLRKSNRIDTTTAKSATDIKLKVKLDMKSTKEVTKVPNSSSGKKSSQKIPDSINSVESIDHSLKCKEEKLLKSNQETPNKLFLKPKRYSKERENILGRDDPASVESQQDIPPSEDRKIESIQKVPHDTLRRSMRDTKGKMKSKDEIDSKCTPKSDDSERQLGKCFADEYFKESPETDHSSSEGNITRRRSTRIKSLGSADKDLIDDSQLKTKSDISNVKLEHILPLKCQLFKESLTKEKSEQGLSSNRCLRSRDSKTQIPEKPSQKTTDMCKMSSKDSKTEMRKNLLLSNNQGLSNHESKKGFTTEIKGKHLSDENYVKIKEEKLSPIKPMEVIEGNQQEGICKGLPNRKTSSTKGIPDDLLKIDTGKESRTDGRCLRTRVEPSIDCKQEVNIDDESKCTDHVSIGEHQLRKSSRKKQKIVKTVGEEKLKDDKHNEVGSRQYSTNTCVKQKIDSKERMTYNMYQGSSETSSLPVRRSSRVKASPKTTEDVNNCELKVESGTDMVVVQSSNKDLTNSHLLNRKNINLTRTKDHTQEDVIQDEKKLSEIAKEKHNSNGKQIVLQNSFKVHENVSEDNSSERKSDKKNAEMSSSSHLRKLRAGNISEQNEVDIEEGKLQPVTSNDIFIQTPEQLKTKTCIKTFEESKQTSITSDSELIRTRHESTIVISMKPNMEKPTNNATELNKIQKETVKDRSHECDANLQYVSKGAEYLKDVLVETDIVDTKLNIDADQDSRGEIEGPSLLYSDETIVENRDEGSSISEIDKSDEKCCDIGIIRTRQDSKVIISIKQTAETNIEKEFQDKTKKDTSSSKLEKISECFNAGNKSDKHSPLNAQQFETSQPKYSLIQDAKEESCSSPVQGDMMSVTKAMKPCIESHDDKESKVKKDIKIIGKNKFSNMSDGSGEDAIPHSKNELSESNKSVMDADAEDSICSEEIYKEISTSDKPDYTEEKNDSTDKYIVDSDEKLPTNDEISTEEKKLNSTLEPSQNSHKIDKDDVAMVTTVQNDEENKINDGTEEVSIVNIFDQGVPDLNSGRPIRKNKLKKPARYSNEISDDLHTKSKKESKETPIAKSGADTNDKLPAQTTSKSRRDSREKRLTSPSLEKGEVTVPKKTECKNKKSPTLQEDPSALKSKREHQKEKGNTNSNAKDTQSPPLKSRKLSKDVNDLKTKEKSTILRQRKDGKETEVKEDGTKEDGTRRSVNKKIPIKGSKIMKPKISLQTVTGRKHGHVNAKFEEKYEIFKKKWKEEKERRRKLQYQEEEMKSGSKINVQKTMENVTKVARQGNIKKKNAILNVTEKKEVLKTDSNRSENVEETSKNIEKKHMSSDSSFKNVDEFTDRDVKVESLPEEKKKEVDIDIVPVSTEVKKENLFEKAVMKVRHRIKHTPNSRFGKASPVQSSLNTSKKRGRPARSKDDSTKNETEISISEDKEASIKPATSHVSHKDPNVSQEEIDKCSTGNAHAVDAISLASSSNDGEITGHDVPGNEKASLTKLMESASSECIKKTRAFVTRKGRPKKIRKIDDGDYIPDPTDAHKLVRDISRTPSDTISFASMIEEERPSQKKRPEIDKRCMTTVKRKHHSVSPQKLFQPRFIVQNFNHRPFFTFAPRQASFPTAAQIVASRIQKRVHQQKLMAMLNSPEPAPNYKSTMELCNYPPGDSRMSTVITERDPVCLGDDSDDNIVVVQPSSDPIDKSEGNEIDIMDITLNKAKKEENTMKKRKSLDFITGRYDT